MLDFLYRNHPRERARETQKEGVERIKDRDEMNDRKREGEGKKIILTDCT